MAASKVSNPILSGLASLVAPLVEPRLAGTLIAALDRHFNDRLLPDLQERVENIANDALQPKRESIQQLVMEIADGVFQSKQENFRQWAEQHIHDVLQDALTQSAKIIVDGALQAAQSANPLIGSRLYRPNDIMAGSVDGPYMAASNVLARDFLHPEFAAFCRLCSHPIVTHRKLWEWAFIYHHARMADAIEPGRRGLGFGVGQEFLPALFAGLGLRITATDSPYDNGWRDNNEYSSSLEQLFHPGVIEREAFEQRVSFEPVDMNAIPAHLNEFDFCWSSCSFEHLGSLQHGIDFVINSVEKTLKIGGVACHTTELNLTSDEDTIETGEAVIYRKKDLEFLCRRLEERGHQVKPLRLEPGHLVADYLVDMPPYRSDPCLKFQLGQYVSTSVGIVARRGR